MVLHLCRPRPQRALRGDCGYHARKRSIYPRALLWGQCRHDRDRKPISGTRRAGWLAGNCCWFAILLLWSRCRLLLLPLWRHNKRWCRPSLLCVVCSTLEKWCGRVGIYRVQNHGVAWAGRCHGSLPGRTRQQHFRAGLWAGGITPVCRDGAQRTSSDLVSSTKLNGSDYTRAAPVNPGPRTRNWMDT